MSRRKSSVPKKKRNESLECIQGQELGVSNLSSGDKQTTGIKDFILRVKPTKSENSCIYIGDLSVGACCSNSENESVLNDDEFINVLHNGVLSRLELVTEKQLILDVAKSSIIYYDICICNNLYVLKLKIHLNDKILYTKFTKVLNKLLSNIYQKTFGYTYEERDFQKRHNLDELYDAIKKFSPERTFVDFDALRDCPQLKPQLRPYQNKAVRWMLACEKHEDSEKVPHPIYEPLILPNDEILYYNETNGHLTKDLPMLNPFPTGGILADEMGLGKTLEVLACVLANRRGIKDAETSDDDMSDFDDDTEEYEYPTSSKKKRKRLVEYEFRKKRISTNAIGYKQRNLIQCLCGEKSYQRNEIQCTNCHKVQHLSCVGLIKKIDNYYCPQCFENKPPIKSRATLIISPKSISRQWFSEIKRHIQKNSIKVFVYRGIAKDGYIYPTELANNDVVLTMYNVLQSEIKFSDVEISSRNLRFEKKYHSPSTPLTMIEWWRVCLDEAQMVDSATSLVANMARRIPAIHRWAVSGTPAQRGIKDFFGLISFLGIEPYNEIKMWNKLLFNPYCYGDKEPLEKFLAKILWRTAKNDVLEEINIPKQTEEIYWLKFSPIEEFFYKKEHEMCSTSLQKRLRRYDSLDITLDSLDRHVLNKILMPLLTLRHACIHAHAVRGRYLTSKRNVVSMEDLLEALIDKNLNECEESLRVNISVLNGLAGIHMLREEWSLAAQSYRDVLSLAEQHKDRLKIDILPRLHTLHNLANLLESNYPGANIPPTLRDGLLRTQVTALEEQYMQRRRALVLTAEEDIKKITDEVKVVEAKFDSISGAWLSELVDWLDVNELTTEMIDRIQASLLDNHANNTVSIADSLTSSWTVIYQMSIWFDKITCKLQKLSKDFDNLKKQSVSELNRFPEVMVRDVINCHLRPMKDEKIKKKLCYFCKIEEEMKQYECLIFKISTKQSKTKRKFVEQDDDANKRMQGSWQRTQQEVVMRVLIPFGRQKNAPENLTKDGEAHVELYELYKKQFKEMRRLWTYYSEQIAAQDELNMSKERFRLRLPNEQVSSERKVVTLKNLDYSIENKLETINVLDPHMVDITFDLLLSDKNTERADLSRKLGTLNYLETLRKSRYAGQKPDPCPICTNQLKDHWSVLTCGHSFCLDCMHHLLEQCSYTKSLSCSVCRQVQSYQDISYVKLSNENVSETSDVYIKGSFSTKIEAILTCVLKLIRDDPTVKILVFSSWDQVLQVVASSFSMNNISFCHFMCSNHEKLEEFKDSSKNVTALLLPIKAGAKGLNLIEATHVILVEPLMNPGEEMQAIGRVHRIGQTKPTVVHRFLISHSIEESIYKSMSSNDTKWKKDVITLRSIQELFQQSNQSLSET